MIIRKAKIKDLEKISSFGMKLLRLHKDIDSYFMPASNAKSSYCEYFRKRIYSSQKIILVAEKNKTLIGFIVAEIRNRPSIFKIKKVGAISDIYVVKKFREHGVGEKLLKEVFSWFKGQKIKYIETTVHIKNIVGMKAWTEYKFKDFLIVKRTKL